MTSLAAAAGDPAAGGAGRGAWRMPRPSETGAVGPSAYAGRMSDTDPRRGAPGPAALNDAIRTLWVRAGEERRPLTADEQRIYQVLVAAWTEAVQTGQELAA